ncbi:hypothetical protein C0Q70_04273 [Pomacea canaliculata]|uniref:SOCS box domain-containing protein n=1 Tax=Pomacea canaliculata TaxID=400727 RepID=A0A2T7PV18_POMCA|nr:uncharacterized protein LOC112557921 [Pomacea canaliculata]XP_025083860.1 uncharacterized protein LOC112557921 [Pomacea canaliculata]PVD37276.1 hypothetical protein C0Q70_04273 [Pomacea canaliculata]
MGISCSHDTLTHSSREADQKDFYQQMCLGKRGQLLHVCSYSKWTHTRRIQCGFTDRADYTTPRDSHHRYGILVKPDTTNGRYFSVTWKSNTEVQLKEKSVLSSFSVKVPRIPSAGDHNRHHQWFHSRNNRRHRECSIVACYGNMAVMQVNSDRHFVTGKFYILDLHKQICLGYFLVLYHTRRWYEVYISPSKICILLRPDHLTRIVVHPDIYVIQNVHVFEGAGLLRISHIPSFLRAHSLAFNPILGDGAMILGLGRDIEVRSCHGDWPILQQHSNLNLPADIQQIRTSAHGNFLAVRCVHPVHSREYLTNYVVVLSFPQISVLMQLDARGCYWPVSEVINLQVFPRFSPSEACVAVMRNCHYKRRVFVYKLPTLINSLQELCRRAVLHLVSLQDLNKLPLPIKLLEYIQGGAEPSIVYRSSDSLE